MTLEFDFINWPGMNNRQNKEHLQHLCAVDELCVPAVVGPDEMEDGVDDIDTMFH
jgi:hypothetical protein